MCPEKAWVRRDAIAKAIALVRIPVYETHP